MTAKEWYMLAGLWAAVWPALPGRGAPPLPWRELFAQDDPLPAGEAARSILAAAGDDAGRLKALLAADDAYDRLRPGWHRRSATVSDGKDLYQVEYWVRVPEGIAPARGHPLVCVAHGTGGNGKAMGEDLAARLAGAAERYVISAPTLPGPKTFNGKPYQEQTHLLALRWVRRNLNIDDDRIYFVGYSQGGHTAWHMAAMYPRLYAAAVPMAGVPWFEGSPQVTELYLVNLRGLPVWALWGELDRADPDRPGTVDLCRAAAKRLKELGAEGFRGTELPGKAHAGNYPNPGRLAEFLAAHARPRAPEQFDHCFHLEHHCRGYYVEATRLLHKPTDFDHPGQLRISVQPGQKLTPQQVDQHVTRQLAGSMFRISARLDRKANSLSVVTTGIGAVRVYVVEGLFDLDRPAEVRYARAAWRGKIPRSARCVLTHYAATRDAAAPVYNEIDLDAGGSVTVRFGAK